jgi:CheY-like chemotaxis protein
LANRPSILVVDDEPGILEFLRYVLEDNGYQVRTAPNGAVALTLISDTVPDLVLTDLMMPELDGWALCQELREDVRLRETPIVGMSAVEPGRVRWDAFLRKPFEIDDLLAVLASFLPAQPVMERQ